MEFASPIPYYARNESETAELQRERDELKATIEKESGKGWSPLVANAKARLQSVERELSMAAHGQRLKLVSAPAPARHSAANAAPEYAPPRPYYETAAPVMAANSDGTDAQRIFHNLTWAERAALIDYTMTELRRVARK